MSLYLMDVGNAVVKSWFIDLRENAGKKSSGRALKKLKEEKQWLGNQRARGNLPRAKNLE